MNNNLQNNGNNPFEIFDYNNLGSVRSMIDNQGNPWFCLKDVCDILGISSHRNVVNRLVPKGVCTMDSLTNGGVQSLIFIDEGNLFKTINNSRKPEAQNFWDWVCYTVIPSIRKNGYFAMNEMSQMEMIHKMSGVIIEHSKRMDGFDNRFITVEERLNGHDVILEDVNTSLNTLLQHSAVTIAGFINLYKLPINPSSENLRNLGLQAKQLTESRGFTVGSIYDERWGKVNVYPVDILQELFSTIS